MKEQLVVKCKEYYWGFCRLIKADEDGNREECIREKCDKFKTEIKLRRSK